MFRVASLTSGTSAASEIKAGNYVLAVSGTFNGATVRFELDIAGVGFVPVENVSFTAPKATGIALPSGNVRISISSPGVGTAINAALSALKQD